MRVAPPVPINRSVNDHSFYWYVQTTNIAMFPAFINAFSSRLRVKDDPFDQHVSLFIDFLCRVVVRTNSQNKQLVRGINTICEGKFKCQQAAER